MIVIFFLLLLFPIQWSRRPRGGIFSSWVIYAPHLRALPVPALPYSFKMFKPLFIKFAPVLPMLLLTLAVQYYGRILNGYPLLQVKKIAVKLESFVEWSRMPSTASWWGFALNTGPLSTWTRTRHCQMLGLEPATPAPPVLPPPHALVGFPFGVGWVGPWCCTCSGKYGGKTPCAASGESQSWPSPSRSLCSCSFFFFFSSTNNYRCNLSDLSV